MMTLTREAERDVSARKICHYQSAIKAMRNNKQALPPRLGRATFYRHFPGGFKTPQPLTSRYIIVASATIYALSSPPGRPSFHATQACYKFSSSRRHADS